MYGPNQIASKRIGWIPVVILLSIAYYLFGQWEGFINPWMISDDASEHTFWAYQYRVEGQFQAADFLPDVAETIQPWGIYVLHRSMAMITDPLTAAKVLPIFLFVLAALFLFATLKRRFGLLMAAGGTILMGYFLLKPIAGFHARSFAYPLLFAYLYYLDKNPFHIGQWVVCGLASLLYPSMALILILMTGLHYMTRWFMTGKWPLDIRQAVGWGLLITAIGIVLFAKSYQIEHHPAIGHMLSPEALCQMEELGIHGRVKLLPQLAPLSDIVGFYFQKSLSNKLIFALGGLFLSLILIKRIKLNDWDRLLFCLIASGLILFFLARIFFFKLFFPIRYVEYTNMVFAHLVLIRMVWILTRRVSRQIVPWVFIAFSTFLSVFYFKPEHEGMRDMSQWAKVYAHIKTLPAQTLIAGPMRACDQIPMFAQKSVLFSYEAAHLLYYDTYWPNLKQRMQDFYAAYFTHDHDTLRSFIQDHEVDYILLDQRHFVGGKAYGFQPIKRQIETLQAADRFILPYLPSQCYISIDEHYQLIDCQAYLTLKTFVDAPQDHQSSEPSDQPAGAQSDPGTDSHYATGGL